MASFQKRGENSWLLVVEVGYDARGKRKKRTKTIKVEDKSLLRTTKKLNDYLELELAKFKIEVESGEYIAPEKMKFCDFVDEWKTKYAVKNLADKTLTNYLGSIKNHINPFFGNFRLDQIKPIHLVNFFDSISKEGARKDGKGGRLSDSTIYEIDKTLRNIFNRALEWQLIKNSPLESIKRPKIKRKEMKYFNEDEAKQAIIALFKEDAVWRLFFLTAIIGGLRRGEIVALEWGDIDFENNVINVRKNIPMFKNKKPVIKDTKTNEFIRCVSMPKWYMEELKEHLRSWKKEKLLTGHLWKGENYEFIFHNGFGKPFYPEAATNRWIKFRKKHNLKSVRLHDLRHTMVTLLIEEGENIKAIQERAGHSSSRITIDVYGHLTKKASAATASKFDKLNPRKTRKI